MLSLESRHLTILLDILRTHLPGVEVRAFGSRVTGRCKPYSDLDLVVVGRQPLNLSRLCHLQEALAESDLPMRVDIADWQRINESFRRIIDKQYEVIQAEIAEGK